MYHRAMRATCAVVLFVAACGPAPSSPAVPTAPKQPPPRASPSKTTVVSSAADAWTQLCAGPASLPMDVVGSREFVTITLPGSTVPEALRFHVDTGGNTPGLMLHRSVAERLGFSSAEALPRTIHIGDHDVAVPEGASWILLDDAGDAGKLARATRRDFSVGQLGAGFLSRFVVCIDPAKGRLGLGDPKRFDLVVGDVKWLPLIMLSGGSNHALYPFVHVSLTEPSALLPEYKAFAGGYGVLLDTGATTSMLGRYQFEYQREHHRGWATANGAFGDADMIGGQWVEGVLRVDDVALDAPTHALAQAGLKDPASVDVGPATFVDRPTETWSNMFGDVRVYGGSHGAIANDVLLRFRLLIDYPHSRLLMEPSGRNAEQSASSSRIGLSLLFGADGCPEIRQITDTNDKGTRDKLKVGDVLVAVDGQDVCRRHHHEISAALAGPPGTKMKLSLRRGGATLDVDAVTAELLVRR